MMSAFEEHDVAARRSVRLRRAFVEERSRQALAIAGEFVADVYVAKGFACRKI